MIAAGIPSIVRSVPRAKSSPRKRRGAPLVVLLSLLGSWAGTRTYLWEDPFTNGGVLSAPAQQLVLSGEAEDGSLMPAGAIGNIASRNANSAGAGQSTDEIIANLNHLFQFQTTQAVSQPAAALGPVFQTTRQPPAYAYSRYPRGRPMLGGLRHPKFAKGNAALDGLTLTGLKETYRTAGHPPHFASWYKNHLQESALMDGQPPLFSGPFSTGPQGVAFSKPFSSLYGSPNFVPQTGPNLPPPTSQYPDAIARADPQAKPDRWSLDTYAFLRQGSDSADISQGRVPVYGASQLAANLQYRLAPRSMADPRIYLRSYRAFVVDGESDVALGVSARPVESVPLRLAAELRMTDSEFGKDWRPAAYAITDIAPQELPLDTMLELYGGAGYVGGKADTFFVDGQLSVTREVMRINGPGDKPIRFSFGAAAWGGAQRDAGRLDVGPTMRVDLMLGEVPTRLTIDWRGRQLGDAAPDSGLAATLSTRF